MNKNEIRKEIIEKRSTLDPVWVSENSIAVQESALMLPEIMKAQSVFCYLGVGGEVLTERLINYCWENQKVVCVPAYRKDQMLYKPVVLEKDAVMSTGMFDIPEPEQKSWVPIENIDLAIIPGLGFDVQCGRVGFGKGFYDLMLADSDMFKIGLCFEFQIYDSVPVSETDIGMDVVVTEKRILRCPVQD